MVVGNRDAMGAHLCTAQKGVYYFVINVLTVVNVKFSKDELKQFI